MRLAECLALTVAAGAAMALTTTGSRADGAIRLVDQDDRPATNDDWRGRPAVLDFVFAQCGDVCPTRTAELARMRDDLPTAVRQAVRFASVTIDPEHDDPAALRAYSRRLGADQPGWSFLTGSPTEIARLATRYQVPATRPGEIASHVETLFLLDRAGAVAKAYVGEAIDEAALGRDVEALASQVAPAEAR